MYNAITNSWAANDVDVPDDCENFKRFFPSRDSNQFLKGIHHYHGIMCPFIQYSTIYCEITRVRSPYVVTTVNNDKPINIIHVNIKYVPVRGETETNVLVMFDYTTPCMKVKVANLIGEDETPFPIFSPNYYDVFEYNKNNEVVHRVVHHKCLLILDKFSETDVYSTRLKQFCETNGIDYFNLDEGDCFLLSNELRRLEGKIN